MSFLAELKRRRVGKVAIAYGAIAWVVTEASSVVLPALRLPEWTVTFIVVFLLIGFPIAMLLAWIFDVGPQGIERTEPLAGTPPSMHTRLRFAYVALVLVCMAGLGYLLYERGVDRAQAGEPHGSIAVLPFTNLSGDPARDYFSDGMSEELLNLLARVPGLEVASRTSSFAYKGRNLDIREVGRELGVETVLEGSVRQAGDQVRITAQLIDTESGFHLWSETYDRKLADIFQVQDEIAGAIVEKLRIELGPKDQRLAMRDKAPTRDVEAYEHYLKGRAAWKRRGEENIRQAIDLYQSALASAYVVLPGYTEQDDADEYLALAETAARQAPSLDPNIGEAHAVLAQINAERGDLLDAALAQAKRAQELDPASPVIAANLANAYLQMGDDEQALRYSKIATDLGIGRKHSGVETSVAVRRKQWDAARREIVQQEGIPKEIGQQAVEFIDALADPSLAPRLVAKLRAVDPVAVPRMTLVGPYMQLGQIDLVYQILFESLEQDPAAWVDEWDLGIAWSDEGTAFRTDPRFVHLAERIGMVDYWKQYGYPDRCRAGTDTPLVCS